MEGFGLIIRTNAKDADEETLMEEIYSLKGEYERIIQKAPFRNCCSLLYQGPASSSLQASGTATLHSLRKSLPMNRICMSRLPRILKRNSRKTKGSCAFTRIPSFPLKVFIIWTAPWKMLYPERYG